MSCRSITRWFLVGMSVASLIAGAEALWHRDWFWVALSLVIVAGAWGLRDGLRER